MCSSILRLGHEWSWKLEDIDDRWSNARLVEDSGKVAATYHYVVTEKTKRPTSFGPLNCFVILGMASNRVGQSQLRSYFHPKYGFVRLEYSNVDGSKLSLELMKLKPQLQCPTEGVR